VLQQDFLSLLHRQLLGHLHGRNISRTGILPV